MADLNAAAMTRLATGPVRGVDDATEILTDRGWLYQRQLRTSDRVWALDPMTVTARWEPVHGVQRSNDDVHRLRRIELGGLSIRATAGLRWPIQHRGSRDAFTWRQVEGILHSSRLFRAVDRGQEPKLVYSDALVELVAWFWCEGHRTNQKATGHPDRDRRTTVAITQSSRANPQHCAAIARALDQEFPGGWVAHDAPDGKRTHRVQADPSAVLLSLTGEDKAPTPKFLIALTDQQLALFIRRCIDADGTVNVNNGGQRVWYQLSEHGMDMFQMACALAGEATNAHKGKNYGNRFGEVPVGVTLLRSRMATPLASIKTKSYGYKKGTPRTPAIDDWIDHHGMVWAPITPSGTWLARRRRSVYFAGGYMLADVVPTDSAIPVQPSARGEQMGLDLGV